MDTPTAGSKTNTAPTRANATATAATPVGGLLRIWRERRRLSQLELAGAADISARHVSFLETGRSVPSRAMLLRLAERLDVPLRERNALLLSAGYAPMYSERRLDDPALRQARAAVDLVIAGHSPYPALAVDRHWTMVSANAPVNLLLAGVDPRLLQPPVNVLRLSLHPDGLGPRVENYTQWRTHVLMRLRQQIAATADPILTELLAELEAYPLISKSDGSAPGGAKRDGAKSDGDAKPTDDTDYGGVVVPFRLRTDFGVLSFFSTTTVFGTPLDVTLSELAIESFFPADPQTTEILNRIAREGVGQQGLRGP
ncbi:MAG TPA: helix-turn-helix transcriptional regulator [Steroidobacteraceae bacterium]|nr:helix-turn-helix transcriptional regulator [Steroidobacteraceae bacterium]